MFVVIIQGSYRGLKCTLILVESVCFSFLVSRPRHYTCLDSVNLYLETGEALLLILDLEIKKGWKVYHDFQAKCSTKRGNKKNRKKWDFVP